jgi:hypothetical protein
MIGANTPNSLTINSINQLSRDDLREIGEALTLPLDHLRKIACDPHASEEKVIVAEAIIRSTGTGNWEVLETLVSRLIGDVR